MTIKMTNLKDEKGNPIKLNQPAFLVGNGINKADKINLSWEDLLGKLLPESSDLTVENLKGLTYPEIAEIALLKQGKDKFEEKFKEEMDKIEADAKESELKNHKKLLEFAKQKHIPILTTNLEKIFLTSDASLEMKWHQQGEKNVYNRKYLKNLCFCDKNFDGNNIHSTFALWYIHGLYYTKSFDKSFSLTNWDYANNIAMMKKVLSERQKNNRTGNSSWADIFLDNDLIILGLGLDSAEIDLRAFLVEKYIQQQIDEKIAKEKHEKFEARKVIYIYRKGYESEDMPDSKKAFFEALGIKCVEMPQDEIYVIDKYLK